MCQGQGNIGRIFQGKVKKLKAANAPESTPVDGKLEAPCGGTTRAGFTCTTHISGPHPALCTCLLRTPE